MVENNYDVLDAEIGEIGEDKPLKKLKHKASYGQKEDLTSEEQSKLDAFLARSNSHKNQDASPISQGWIPIDREEMGIRSIFYPESWEFMIRPATVQAIKNWTAIDEERPDVVNNVFNEIIKTCVKIVTNSDQGASWAQLRSWDRFWFVLKVREYTYAQGQNNIEFEDECSECGTDIHYELKSTSMFYEFQTKILLKSIGMGNVGRLILENMM